TLAISPARTISPIRGVFCPSKLALSPTALITTVLCMPPAAYHPAPICSLHPVPALQFLDFILNPAGPLFFHLLLHLLRLNPHRERLTLHLPFVHDSSRSWHSHHLRYATSMRQPAIR